MPVENLIGRKFNRLLVVGRAENLKGGQSRWICKCDCGGECISPRSYLIKHQIGCKKCSRHKPYTHKLSHLPENSIWNRMKQRCQNPNDKGYNNYGGRGIKVCERWQKFENFYADMGNRPTSAHTLERVNNDGNYEPENCKWATRKEQARNFRQNRLLEFNGQIKCISEWAEFYGLTHDTIARRLKRGYTIEQALTNPIKPNKKTIKVNGELMSLSAAERLLGLGTGTIGWRLRNGYSEEQAVTTLLNWENPYRNSNNIEKAL